MAAIDNLIAQIEDEALRDRLCEEVKRLTKEKKFGVYKCSKYLTLY